MTVDTTSWQSRAQALADDLAARGDVRALGWAEAVAAIPRHELVPVVYVQDQHGWSTVDTNTEAGLDLAYSRTTLVTALAQRSGYQEAVSSSTKPDLMVRMLELLDVQDDDRVLEIGTGTGYNAALLSHRLGSERVFSVDVDPELVRLARERLAAVGYTPTLVAADGDQGLPQQAPYEKIIATCAAPCVPWAWVEQTAPGGLLLVDLKLGTSAGNLALLTRTGSGAQGRFTERWAGFMEMRHNLAVTSEPPVKDSSDNVAGELWEYETQAPMAPWMTTVPWFLAHFSLPVPVRFGYQLDAYTREPNLGTITSADGSSRVEIADADTRRLVTETGPWHIWDAVQSAFDTWNALGEPGWTAFGLTVTPETQTVWFDHPDSGRTWPVTGNTAM